MNHICPNNLLLWQFVTKSQQTNEHMREVINYSTHTHLLNTIKSILAQTLEKLCKKRVYGKKTLTTCIFETLKTKLITTSYCETEIKDCIQYIRSMCIKREKKQHMKRQVKETYISIYVSKGKYNVCQMVIRLIYMR